jgi:hypothetical protein
MQIFQNDQELVLNQLNWWIGGEKTNKYGDI